MKLPGTSGKSIRKQDEGGSSILPEAAGLTGGPLGHGGMKKQKTPAFDFFTQDLTAMASANKFDPVIGRAKEVDRMMSIIT